MMESSLLKEKGAQESLAIPETSAQLLQAAGVQLRVWIDCQTTLEPGPRVGASEMVVASQEPQAGDLGTAVVPIASVQPQAEASGGFGEASSGNYDLPSAQRVLNLIAYRYFQSIAPSNQDEFNGFLQYMENMRKVLIVDVKPGSLIITVECRSLEILEGTVGRLLYRSLE
ncbi:hypothetical protein OS493_034846 [Desmophyllum pertusum]|uniref:Uncharacterized protein n=1 Tax=Desmophyllum pertusum TaxID=174260 RepID=A0A9W9ZWA5_9CNID|nr:hypothetical protein OS493_034846 [Desmophyllum pertusum]